MKYLNHLNAAIALIGVLIIGNTLLGTFWRPNPAKRPTIDLTTSSARPKAGLTAKAPLSPTQGRRSPAAAPVNRPQRPANVPVPQNQATPAEQPVVRTLPPPLTERPSAREGTSGVVGQPGPVGRIDESGAADTGVEEPPGARKEATSPSARARRQPTRSQGFASPANRGVTPKRDQPQADPNAATPPPRSSMPQ